VSRVIVFTYKQTERKPDLQTDNKTNRQHDKQTTEGHTHTQIDVPTHVTILSHSDIQKLIISFHYEDFGISTSSVASFKSGVIMMTREIRLSIACLGTSQMSRKIMIVKSKI
jgi:hypothetical protein